MRRMIVVIELAQIELGVSGGWAILVRELLHTAFRDYPQHRFICLCTIDNSEMFSNAPPNIEVVVPPKDAYFQEIDKLYRLGWLDVVIRSYPLHGCCTVPPARQVYLIPDLQHEFYPQFFEPVVLESRRAGFREALQGAGAIGTISEFSRDTIRSHSETKCTDVFLCPPALVGADDGGGNGDEAEAGSGICDGAPGSDYFLYPANCWPHKNHRRVLQAFEAYLQDTKADTQFVFTGHPDGWNALQEEFGHLPIHHRQFVPFSHMRSLHQRALALVFFSLYEGFGMPLLDAFRWGTSVICSNLTSLPEVAGNAALTCDPRDVKAMVELMGRISTDQPLRDRLVASGREPLRMYDWQRSASALMAACLRVVQRQRRPIARRSIQR